MSALRLGTSSSNPTMMPYPKKDGGIVTGYADIGTARRTWDGDLRVDLADRKRTWTIQWAKLSASDVSTIETEVNRDQALYLDPMTGSTVLVWVKSFQKTQIKTSDGLRWDATLVAEEV